MVMIMSMEEKGGEDLHLEPANTTVQMSQGCSNPGHSVYGCCCDYDCVYAAGHRENSKAHNHKLHGLQDVARCLLPAASCLWPDASCLSLTAHCLLPQAYCLGPNASCLLPAAY